MAPKSSALVVSYDLRPGKQCERMIMVDSLWTAMEAGYRVSSYRYVGMGANRFYDFVMMHKYLGIGNMISIEHDPEMYQRAMFNRPFEFISVVQTSANDFVLTDRYSGNTVYWLDYDSRIDPNMVQDVRDLCPRVAVGDFVFVTVNGMVPRSLEPLGSVARLAETRELFGDTAASLEVTDVEKASFPVAARKILEAAFKNAFSSRSDGTFCPFFQIRYADSTEMLSMGGVFDGSDRSSQLMELLKCRMPFLQRGTDDPYQIGRFDYTERERRLLDFAVTARRKNAKELGQLQTLGFDAQDINRYRELLRYHPRYVETFI